MVDFHCMTWLMLHSGNECLLWTRNGAQIHSLVFKKCNLTSFKLQKILAIFYQMTCIVFPNETGNCPYLRKNGLENFYNTTEHRQRVLPNEKKMYLLIFFLKMLIIKNLNMLKPGKFL